MAIKKLLAIKKQATKCNAFFHSIHAFAMGEPRNSQTAKKLPICNSKI
jgi:hypothetical protein